MRNKKELLILIFILITAGILRFYNLMHDAPYFFDPDERNMANAISQFSLSAKLSEIPNCILSQFQMTNDKRLMTDCNLNPHFFAYGQFPLYLAFTSDQITKSISHLFLNIPITNDQLLMTNFPSAIFWLRFWSALSSTLTILLVFLISRKLFTFHFALFTSLLAAFTPGLTQSAHFGTTESFLTFFFLASVYLSLQLLENPFPTSLKKYLILNTKYLILIFLTIGLALGSKLTGIFFFIPPAISLIMRINELLRKKSKNKLSVLLGYWLIGLLIIVGSSLIFFLSSPYNLVDPQDFKSAIFGYESDVAMGRYEAFYTRQFVNTTPIIFQAEKIFPYTLGVPVFILGSIGFLLMNLQLLIPIIYSIRKKLRIINYKLHINGRINNSFIILNLSFIIYLLSNAFLFAKWTRFMTPVFPFFVIFAAYAVNSIYNLFNNHQAKIQNSKLKVQINIKNVKFNNLLGYWVIGLLVFISVLPGIVFMSIYTHEDSRLTASKWIYKNIPNNSYILSETANVVDIPLGLSNNLNTAMKNYEVISFDFYHIDENPNLGLNALLANLEKADYIFIPSRRIFANYTRLPQQYPLVTKYYQLLFSGALGFEKISEINSYPTLGPFKFPDEQAEETYTVFDHPVIRIYKKVNNYSGKYLLNLFGVNSPI